MDQLLAHVEFVHGGPQSVMPYSIKGLLKINEDMENVLLMLAVFLTQNPQVEYLFCGASIWAETGLLFGDDLFCLWFQPVQDHLQHDFTGMTYEADRPVVLALLEISFLGESDDE